MTQHSLHSRLLRGALTLFLLAILLGTLRPQSAQADLIFLKDGTVLQGLVKRESKLEIDPITKEAFTIPVGNYWVDDGPRRIYFAQYNVGRVENKVAVQEERITFKHKDIIFNPRPLPVLDAVYDNPDFDDNWKRKVNVRVAGRELKMGQGISIMTPYWSRIDCTDIFIWGGAYMTRELGQDQVRRLISVHPDFEEKPRMTEMEKATRRFRYVDFFTQAGWYSEAESELQRILEDLPTQKEKAEAGLKVLHAIMARERFEEIKRLHLAGIYDLARTRATNFPLALADEKIQADVTEFQAESKKNLERITEARKILGELVGELKSRDATVLTEAARVLATDLHPGNLARLDTFLGQARQWSRLKAQNAKQENTPEEVLALAITGWYLGSTAAETRVESAVKLWQARSLILEVLKAPNTAARQQLIAAYQNLPAREQMSLDWFVQMIPILPPPAPEEQIPEGPVTLTGFGSSYLLQLPPEYRHSHSYPVFILLHDANEKAETMLRRWNEALDHGYIVVAIPWEANSGYQYSTQEHELVLGALRDVRRRFNVDSDRVFLHGLGQGGTMAFDVGLSHPDQFAGVIPMSPVPDYFILKYWRNSLYLPLYVVTGERIGDAGKKVKSLFDAIMSNYYSALWVQYKGRGVEWFAGEVPLILDWMRGKTRAFPMHQLGNDDGAKGPRGDFQCMRASDSKFYWLSSDFVLPRCLTTAQTFTNQVVPATFAASADPVRNLIVVRPTGVKQLTVWLGRNARGQTTINFDKPVSVQVQNTLRIINQKVTPSLAVLLEDLALRGDRQQLFLARLDLNF